jgi:ABC-type uncharacterized transport system involved in gliding motility auxiliary subunit
MKRFWFSTAGLLLLAVMFFTFSVANNFLFSNWKLDFTQQKLYTLSEGTKSIIAKTKEPIKLYFFFSDKATQDKAELAGWRSYAKNVREMLKEYETLSGGTIKLTVIDPAPFSEEEDKAAEFGLQKIPLGQGEEVYFGLVGSNSLDTQEILPFFQQEQEEFLEYDLTKMIQKLANPKRPLVNMVTGISVAGDFDPNEHSRTPPWAITESIKEIFDFRKITEGSPHIDANASVLMVVQPNELSEESLYEIDQYVMKGGKAIFFIDPNAELGGDIDSNAVVKKLFQSWGIQIRDKVVVTDMAQALSVNVANNPSAVRHIALLGITGQSIATNQVATAGLERVNVSTAGIIDHITGATTNFTPLLTTSASAMPMDVAMFKRLRDPTILINEFSPTGETYTIGALITGPAKSIFTKAREGSALVDKTDNINVMVVADSDILSDRLWVSTQNYYGQSVSQPWADNGSFVINAIDFFTGDDDLISVRSRGRFSRPFSVVDALRSVADQRFYESEQKLEQQLSEAEHKLGELQNEKDMQGKMVLSPEQEKAIIQYQQQKVQIRKELRNVKHQLNSDIEQLGMYVKWITLGAVPLLLTIIALLAHFIRRRPLIKKS